MTPVALCVAVGRGCLHRPARGSVALAEEAFQQQRGRMGTAGRMQSSSGAAAGGMLGELMLRINPALSAC